MIKRSPKVVRDGHRALADVIRCAYCDRVGTSTTDPDGNSWHMDHVMPLALGGYDALDNLVKACALCNSAKGIDSDWEPIHGTRRADGFEYFTCGTASWHIQQLRDKVAELRAQLLELEQEVSLINQKQVSLVKNINMATEQVMGIYHATIDALMDCA